MSDTSTNSDERWPAVSTTPGGVRVHILSVDEWLERTGQGNHATLSTPPSRMPEPAPALEPEDAALTETQPELADNG